MSGRNQLLAGPNDLPRSSAQPQEACRVHGIRTDGNGMPVFQFTSQRVDWRTLHGVNVDALVSLQPSLTCSIETS